MYQKKGQRLVEFPRKRPRGRMRGIFGVPGLQLQVSILVFPMNNGFNNLFYRDLHLMQVPKTLQVILILIMKIV